MCAKQYKINSEHIVELVYISSGVSAFVCGDRIADKCGP